MLLLSREKLYFFTFLNIHKGPFKDTPIMRETGSNLGWLGGKRKRNLFATSSLRDKI